MGTEPRRSAGHTQNAKSNTGPHGARSWLSTLTSVRIYTSWGGASTSFPSSLRVQEAFSIQLGECATHFSLLSRLRRTTDRRRGSREPTAAYRRKQEADEVRETEHLGYNIQHDKTSEHPVLFVISSLQFPFSLKPSRVRFRWFRQTRRIENYVLLDFPGCPRRVCSE